MKFIKNFFEKLEPKVEKNKLLHTTWDAFFTFFFQPNRTTIDGAHIRDGLDIKRTMFHVVIALQVCLLFGAWNIGHQHYAAFGEFTGYFDGLLQKLFFGVFQLLPVVIVSHVVGLGLEFWLCSRKGHPVDEGFLVSALLIPLIMPPDVPLWTVAGATAFAVFIGKEAFGGTGMNLLNVALTARAFLFFSYPGEMTGDSIWYTLDTNFLHDLFGLGAQGIADGVQAVTGATPLGLAALSEGFKPEGVEAAAMFGKEAIDYNFSFGEMIFGVMPGSIGETSAIACLMGAGILLVTKIASARIMISMLFGCIFMGVLFNLFGGSAYLEVPWYYHPFMGGFLFAMVFMATDPVTAAQTATGKVIYGLMIGVCGMIIRVLNPAYPEGWMLAILFMNVIAPLIDHVVISSNIKRRLARG